MNPLSCEQVRELAAELALDVLPGDERAAALVHLSTCPACQAVVDELAAAADQLLLALPEADPPPGFATRTLAAMHPEPALHTRRRWLRPALLAAAALVLVVAAVTGLLAREADHSGPRQAVALPLEAPGGAAIGELTLSAADPPWISMSIDKGEGTHDYICVLDLDDGTTVTIGPLQVTDGSGSWGRQLAVDVERVRTARVVDDDGRTIAAADLT